MIKTLRRCKWEEVKIGEVFAINGCWWIFYKYSESNYIPLADTFFAMGHYTKNGVLSQKGSEFLTTYENDIYKLPKSFQRNFIDWGKR